METKNEVKLWGVQCTLASGKKVLSFRHKELGKGLYFCEGKGGGKYMPTPPPTLFLTKTEATEALNASTSGKTSLKKLKEHFVSVIKSKNEKVVRVNLNY